MAGQIRQMIDSIIQKRSSGGNVVVTTTITKLILKGLNPEKFNATSPDDPATIAKVRAIAVELGISL